MNNAVASYPAYYLSVTADLTTLALMAEYDALLDALWSKSTDDNRSEVAACEAFCAAHPAIQALMWAAEAA